MEMDDIDEGLAFLENNEGVNGIAQEKGESHPTKERVHAFKSRVFGLLLLFVEKSKDLSPLFENLSQEIFLQEPQKMQELLSKVLNRKGIGAEKLQQIAQYYKNLLLFKTSKSNQKYTEGFVRILRSLHAESPQFANQLVQEMLQIFLIKRKCKLQAGFFHFLLRRIPTLKATLLERCLTIEQNEKLRPAQERVLEKLKKQLVGRQNVKVEVEGQQQ